MLPDNLIICFDFSFEIVPFSLGKEQIIIGLGVELPHPQHRT
jgi:hypothetical protein